MGTELSVPSAQRKQSVHGDYGNVRKETFRIRGLKLCFIEDFISLCGGRAVLKNKTTSEVYEEFLLPLLEMFPGQSLCDILRTHPAVGEHAQVYVVHAWQCMFLETVEALLQHFADKPDVVLWMDLFCDASAKLSAALSPPHTPHTGLAAPPGPLSVLPPHQSFVPHLSQQQQQQRMDSNTCGAFSSDSDCLFGLSSSLGPSATLDFDALSAFSAAPHSSSPNGPSFSSSSITHQASLTQDLSQELYAQERVLTSISQAVLVVCNWHHPLALTRTWCLWELYLIHSHSIPFAVAHSAAQRELLLTQIMCGATKTVDRLQSLVNLPLSLCHTQEVRNTFMRVIERCVGAVSVNDAVRVLLAQYVTSLCEAEVAALSQARPSPSNTHKSTARNAHHTKSLPAPTAAAHNALSQSDRLVWVKLALAALHERNGSLSLAESLLRECLVRLTAPPHNTHTTSAAAAAQVPSSLTLTASMAHSLSLDVLSSLGGVYLAQRQFKKAHTTFTDCLKKRKRTHGDCHPLTLVAIHHVALTLLHQRQFSKAEKMLRDCLEKMCHVLGETHADSVACRESLHVLLCEQRSGSGVSVCESGKERENGSGTSSSSDSSSDDGLDARGSLAYSLSLSLSHTAAATGSSLLCEDDSPLLFTFDRHTTPAHNATSQQQQSSAAVYAELLSFNTLSQHPLHHGGGGVGEDDSMFLECLRSVFADDHFDAVPHGALSLSQSLPMCSESTAALGAPLFQRSHSLSLPFTTEGESALCVAPPTVSELRKRERERESGSVHHLSALRFDDESEREYFGLSALVEPSSPATTNSGTSSFDEDNAFKRLKT